MRPCLKTPKRKKKTEKVQTKGFNTEENKHIEENKTKYKQNRELIKPKSTFGFIFPMLTKQTRKEIVKRGCNDKIY